MNTNIDSPPPSVHEGGLERGCAPLLDLDFIAGLIDSDGSLQLGLEKSPKSQTGYTPKIILDITNTDRKVLELVQNTLGFGLVVSPSLTTFAYRSNTHTNAEKIVKLFENRVHGLAKVEMPLWKHALELVTTRKTRSFEGLSEFVHLMYAINTKGELRTRPITDWLTQFNQPYIKDYVSNFLLRQPIKESLEVPSWYISGYCQGDGSFNLSNKKRFQFNFTLTDADKNILVLIQKKLVPNQNCVFEIDPKTSSFKNRSQIMSQELKRQGVAKQPEAHKKLAPASKLKMNEALFFLADNKKCYRLQITRFQVCKNSIVAHFDKFPVYGHQKKRYELWRKAILLEESKSTRTKAENLSERDAICALFLALKEKVS